MGIGIIMIIAGLMCIFIPRTEWYKDNIEKHNYTNEEEVLGYIRNIVGVILIIFGIMAFIMYFINVFSPNKY